MLPQPRDGSAPAYHGVYPAVVTELVDPNALGRVQVSYPWLGSDGLDVRAWATLCTPYADDGQGLLVLPEVGSQVVVAFEAGNLRRPYILGAAWNGKKSLPYDPERANNIRLLRSRADSRLEFDDTTGAAKVRITMANGHAVVLDQSAQEISITHATGCKIKLTATDIEVDANVTVKLSAPMVQVDAAVSSFSGMVKCGSLVAEQLVTSPSYTPGVGNLQ
ncbi:phage baseplate assembly protein V [Kribbella sp. CA-247076]|uniref:phage baseplate assembly protein V n=1 Tax=Kribbella sp. CA-247076 TaxID=3239941 RepID=UPI003D8D8C8F